MDGLAFYGISPFLPICSDYVIFLYLFDNRLQGYAAISR